MIAPASIGLSEFLEKWYGPPDLPVQEIPAEAAWLPEPLKDWYRLASRWSGPVMRLKRMLPPAEIRLDGRKAVFMEDPTGDWRWAFDSQNPSVVYEAELHGEWTEVAESLADLLVHSALQEATYGARAWRACSQVEESLIADLVAPSTEVALGGWSWPRPGYKVYVSNDIVAEIGPAVDLRNPFNSRPGFVEVRMASCCPSSLDYLDEIPSVEWLAPPQ